MKIVVALLSLISLSTSAAQNSDDCVGVKLGDFVLMSKMVNDRAYERLYAAVEISNKCTDSVQLVGARRDGKLYLEYGLEAKVEFKQPDDRGWLRFPGAGRDGASPPGVVSVNSMQKEAAYVLWPISILIDYPADAMFRIGLADVKKDIHWTPTFQLHDGVRKMRVEHVK